MYRDETRFPEIDILRGVAIILMVVYHIFYDLDYLGIYRFSMNSGTLRIIGRFAAHLFIFTAGISLTLSNSRFRKENGQKSAFPKVLKRGFHIFCWGMIITFVTWMLVPEKTIVFGILHFLGVAIILGYFFLDSSALNIPIALIVIIMGFLFKDINASTNWFLWLGLHSPEFTTLDYFPVFPWFATMLIGITTGSSLYPEYRRAFSFPYNTNGFLSVMLGGLGQQSLMIYLVHQPVIISIMYCVGKMQLPF
jgi:uncharacterized membrane protein